jgi:dolichol-phosphate mannosyltransferase
VNRVTYDLTVIIPTYNESENIDAIILSIDDILITNNIKGQILIVDDDSTDDTQKRVCRLIEKNCTQANLRLISRYSDKGLSQSIIEGIRSSEADIVLVTDADMSHDINKIPDMYWEVNNGADIVIGSRYMPSGGIKDWSIFRRAVSWGANSLARFFFPKLTDPVSGFFAMRKNIILGDSKNPQNTNPELKPNGYKILLEILSKC